MRKRPRVQSTNSLIPDALRHLTAGRELAPETFRPLMHEMMAGRLRDPEIAALLVGLRMKGETAGEIAVAAQVMRDHMIAWNPGRADVVDTCGTGGDGLATFNISTAAAFVLAGAGVPVVKHGNRSVSSKSGSADVLAELGISFGSRPEHLRRCLDEASLAFCFAPLFHPAMKHVGQVRAMLGIPTLFNCLGPLANPAGARRQLLGVGRPELFDRMSGALARLGTERSFVVRSDDGLDEVSLSAPTMVAVVTAGHVEIRRWLPDEFGLAAVSLDEVTVKGAADSARLIAAVLAGEAGPAERLIVANAAAGLLLADRVTTLRDGVDMAREALRSGRAAAVLSRLRSLEPTHEIATALP
jgi:anthranilate phosphoribosyltransferase